MKIGAVKAAPDFGCHTFSDDLHILCLKPFRASSDIELYSLAFLQATKTVALDDREVYENVSAILTADKTVAFGIVKPFHCSLFHYVAYFLSGISAEKNRC